MFSTLKHSTILKKRNEFFLIQEAGLVNTHQKSERSRSNLFFLLTQLPPFLTNDLPHFPHLEISAIPLEILPHLTTVPHVWEEGLVRGLGWLKTLKNTGGNHAHSIGFPLHGRHRMATGMAELDWCLLDLLLLVVVVATGDGVGPAWEMFQ